MAKEFNEEASKRMIEFAKGGQVIQQDLLHDADPNYRDEAGYSALDYATLSHYDTGLYTMNSHNMGALIEAGADP